MIDYKEKYPWLFSGVLKNSKVAEMLGIKDFSNKLRHAPNGRRSFKHFTVSDEQRLAMFAERIDFFIFEPPKKTAPQLQYSYGGIGVYDGIPPPTKKKGSWKRPYKYHR